MDHPRVIIRDQDALGRQLAEGAAHGVASAASTRCIIHGKNGL